MTENYTRSISPIDTESPFDSNTHLKTATSTDPTYDYQEIDDLDDDNERLDNGDRVIPFSSEESTTSLSVSEAIAQMLVNLGVSYAFGVSGGAMATLWGALSNSSIEVIHCRHESGAAYAAVEAYFASDRPVVVFTTAGPGLTNALTGLFAGRGEGAKVIFVSACTSAPQRGRWAIQETSDYTLPSSGMFTSGELFNYATKVECAEQLPQISSRLALGLSQPGGFVAHLSIPTGVQTSSLNAPLPDRELCHLPVTPSEETLTKCVQLLSEGPFAIWLGFGARNAAQEIRQLAEQTGAAVMCSPRAKGIFPEDHPLYVGVTGLGGHASVMQYMQEQPPLRTLVLGTRLGEPTSFWNQAMVPAGGFVHVDIDPLVPGVAYSTAETFPVQSDIKVFLQLLLKYFSVKTDFAALKGQTTARSLPRPQSDAIATGDSDLVRPEILMEAIQQVIVQGSDATILAESGNSFTWATHMLRIDRPNRYRVSTGVGSMGHMAAGVVGAAQARQGKAAVIVGDGSMLMNNEISTAVKYQIPAIWIVLNDARYNMCEQGMKMLGLQGADATMPETDFVMIARGMGADGVRVENEADVQAALEKAIASPGPYVVDVIIDPARIAPSGGRNKSLQAQGVKSSSTNNGNGNGHKEQVSFPMV
jgi:thiamine pyrophosphate-dependent acetolactate synthase large subunit-like protein